MAIDHTEERKLFEEKAYSIYFNGVMTGDQGQWTLSVPMTLLTQAQFFELGQDGRYTNTALETGWSFWKHRAELDASGSLFAVIQDAQQALDAHIKESREQNEVVPHAVAKVSLTLLAVIVEVQALPR